MINLNKRKEVCYVIENGDRLMIIRHSRPFTPKLAKELAYSAGEINRADFKNWIVREIIDNDDLKQCYLRLKEQQKKLNDMGYENSDLAGF